MRPLHTRRLLLSSFSEADVRSVFGYASNPNVARTASWTCHTSIDDSAAFIRFANERVSRKDHGFCCWAIRKKDDGLAVGSISFIRSSEETGRIDYALAEAEWGQGIVTEAAQAVIQWAFLSIPELQAVRSGGLSENVASLRVMSKCGMTFDRKYRVAFTKFNQETREVSEYALTRDEFQARNAAALAKS